jgi:hypothetical protein
VALSATFASIGMRPPQIRAESMLCVVACV